MRQLLLFPRDLPRARGKPTHPIVTRDCEAKSYQLDLNLRVHASDRSNLIRLFFSREKCNSVKLTGRHARKAVNRYLNADENHPHSGDSPKTIDERRGRRRRRKGEGRACNINPFNKLIIDEIYRAFTVRGGGANALHLSQGNPGCISGLAPLRLDLRARANEARPASATKKEVVQDRRGSTRQRVEEHRLEAQRGSWASLNFIHAERWKTESERERESAIFSDYRL